jgi:large subunit ribosomal protein L13
MSCEPQLTKRLGVHQRVTYYLGKLLMKTFTAKPETVKRDWYVVDATGKTLGRLASELALRAVSIKRNTLRTLIPVITSSF